MNSLFISFSESEVLKFFADTYRYKFYAKYNKWED